MGATLPLCRKCKISATANAGGVCIKCLSRTLPRLVSAPPELRKVHRLRSKTVC